MEKLCNALQNHPSLSKLDLARNEFSQDAVRLHLDQITNFKNLKEFFIENDNLGDETLEMIENIFKERK